MFGWLTTRCGFDTQRIETLPTCRAADGTSHHEPLVAGPYLLSRFDGTHAYRNELLEAHNRAAAG